MNSTVFIYLKNDLVKVLDIEQSKSLDKELKKQGFRHIVTLNSAIYLQMLLNLTDEADILHEVKSLKTIHF